MFETARGVVRRWRRRRGDPETVRSRLDGAERRVTTVGDRTANLDVRRCTVEEGNGTTRLVVAVADPERPSLEEYAEDLGYVYTAWYEREMTERLRPLVVGRRFTRGEDGVVAAHLRVDATDAASVERALDRLAATVRRVHSSFHRRVRSAFRDNVDAYLHGSFSPFDVGYGVPESMLPDGFDAREASVYAGEYFAWRLDDGAGSVRDRTDRRLSPGLPSTPVR